MNNDTHIDTDVPSTNNKRIKNEKVFGKDFSFTIVAKNIALYNKAIFRV